MKLKMKELFLRVYMVILLIFVTLAFFVALLLITLFVPFQLFTRRFDDFVNWCFNSLEKCSDFIFSEVENILVEIN